MNHRTHPLKKAGRCIASLLTVIAVGTGIREGYGEETIWRRVATGLDYASFKSDLVPTPGDSTITVLRVDPHQWAIELYSAQQHNDAPLSAKKWSETLGLILAVNAGMFTEDGVTHVGYMKIDGVRTKAGRNKYLSYAAFGPVKPGLPPFRLFDSDDTPTDVFISDYRNVIQNLRLIKRPRENRWRPQEKRWSEAALGEDAGGRMLIIFSRSPYSMDDFNRIILSLPIDLVAAQHLEGGPEAQIYCKVSDFELDLTGSFETAFNENTTTLFRYPIPNIIGIKRKTP